MLSKTRITISIIIKIILLFFAVAFFIEKQWIISFLTLILLILSSRFDELSELTFSAKEIKAVFYKLENIIKSDAPIEQKVAASQELFIKGLFPEGSIKGGRFTGSKIDNFKLYKNEKGDNVISYDEII